MSAFIPPSWIEGLLIYGIYAVIPVIVGVIVFTYTVLVKEDHQVLGSIVLIACVFLATFGSGILWHESYEVPSVQSKIVTVDSWQAKAGIHTNNGMMVIDNADQLMLITTDGEAFLNEENFLFQKFNTRDILNNAHPGAKLNITYYGWREGFNSGFPNILSIDVIDDSHAENKTIYDYFGTKII